MVYNIGVVYRCAAKMRRRENLGLVHHECRLVACAATGVDAACWELANLHSRHHVEVAQGVVFTQNVGHLLQFVDVHFGDVAQRRLHKIATQAITHNNLSHLIAFGGKPDMHQHIVSHRHYGINRLVAQAVEFNPMHTSGQLYREIAVSICYCARSNIININRAVYYALWAFLVVQESRQIKKARLLCLLEQHYLIVNQSIVDIIRFQDFVE